LQYKEKTLQIFFSSHMFSEVRSSYNLLTCVISLCS